MRGASWLGPRTHGLRERRHDGLHAPGIRRHRPERGRGAESLGAENVECYISEFTPLEHALSDARSARGDAAFAKLVCDKTQDLKVIGFHYLGPNAGEITQGFSVAMRKGATYNDFLGTVGIHPTVAEVHDAHGHEGERRLGGQGRLLRLGTAVVSEPRQAGSWPARPDRRAHP